MCGENKGIYTRGEEGGGGRGKWEGCSSRESRDYLEWEERRSAACPLPLAAPCHSFPSILSPTTLVYGSLEAQRLSKSATNICCCRMSTHISINGRLTVIRSP